MNFQPFSMWNEPPKWGILGLHHSTMDFSCELWEYNVIWLVAWNIWIIFPFSWECHHPNWRTNIFQRGWAKQPTSHSYNPSIDGITIDNPNWLNFQRGRAQPPASHIHVDTRWYSRQDQNSGFNELGRSMEQHLVRKNRWLGTPLKMRLVNRDG